MKEANYFIKPEDRETDPESGKEFYTMEDEIASREQQNRKKFAELVDLSNPDLKKFETPDIFISFENLDKIDNVEL